jgi:hypothetical protein
MSNTITPNENDVVSGRGSGANRHKGNLHFRALIKERKDYYLSLSKNLKMGVAREIFDDIASLDPQGRFLQKNPETDSWFQVRRDRALEKISQALREKPHAKKMNHAQAQQQMPKLANQPLNPDGSSHQVVTYASYPQHPPHQQFVPMHQPQVQVVQQPQMMQTVPMGTTSGSMPLNVGRQQHAYQQQPNVSQPYNMGGNQMYSSHQHQQSQPQFPPQGNQVIMHSPSHQNQSYPYSHQPNQQMHQSYSQNQPFPNANTVAVMPVQETMSKQVVYTSSQGRVMASSQTHVPVQQMYLSEMPSIPEVPREYLVDSGTMYKRREGNSMQEPQMYVNGPPPPMAPQQNSYYTGDVIPTTPVHRSRQTYSRNPYEQMHSMPGHGPMPMQHSRNHRVEDHHSFGVLSEDDSLREPTSGKKRKSPGSPGSHGSYDPKRQQISRKEDNVTKESSVATVTKTPTEKGPLTVDTTVEGKSTAALVSPQNDDEKSTAEGTDDKDKGGTETETEEGKGKGSGLKTLSTAASMMSHQ